MVKRVLLIAFHFPPVRGSSGVQRTLSFCRYLPEYGWQPTVLTVDRKAFPLVSEDQLKDVPAGVDVRRAYALDADRHLSLGGWSPDLFSLPDRWASWYWTGTRVARALLRGQRFDAIWSTYPIATAHRIGAEVARVSGVPWVADFRDGMYDEWFPADPARKKWHQRIERDAVKSARRVVVVTNGTRDLYENRYANEPDDKFVCIPNGYDAQILDEVAAEAGSEDHPPGPVRILHSGILYPEERDPTAFFNAIANLKKRGALRADEVQIVLRGSRHEPDFAPMLAELGIDDIVSLPPGIGYRDAIREMFEVDGLLLMQGSSCNLQIPAKVYEYLRVGRPLLALTDERGDTAGLLRNAGFGDIVPIDDVAAIERGLLDYIAAIRAGSYGAPDSAIVTRYSRKAATGQLAGLLNRIVAGPPDGAAG